MGDDKKHPDQNGWEPIGPPSIFDEDYVFPGEGQGVGPYQDVYKRQLLHHLHAAPPQDAPSLEEILAAEEAMPELFALEEAAAAGAEKLHIE